jgi:hypothetical protein
VSGAVADADGVFPREWTLVVEAVTAAASDDPKDFPTTLKRLASPSNNDTRIWLYVFVLLQAAVAQRLGSEPDNERLGQLADRLYPRWQSIVTYEKKTLYDALRTVFGLADAEHEVTGNMGSVSFTVALGVLLSDPVQELADLRAALATFLRENESWLRVDGSRLAPPPCEASR